MTSLWDEKKMSLQKQKSRNKHEYASDVAIYFDFDKIAVRSNWLNQTVFRFKLYKIYVIGLYPFYKAIYKRVQKSMCKTFSKIHFERPVVLVILLYFGHMNTSMQPVYVAGYNKVPEHFHRRYS